MAQEHRGIVARVGGVLRDTLAAFRGVRPEQRSPDGTFGTAQQYSAQRDDERRTKYPRD